MKSDNAEQRPPRAHWTRVLMILPFFAMFWVPSYNLVEPSLGGVPFFYWYQGLWVLICAGIVGIVYWVEHRQDA